MQALIVQGLQGLARLLDKVIPLQGGRTIAVALIAVIAHIGLFLVGQEPGDVAATNILTSLGLIFAALHKPKPADD